MSNHLKELDTIFSNIKELIAEAHTLSEEMVDEYLATDDREERYQRELDILSNYNGVKDLLSELKQRVTTLRKQDEADYTHNTVWRFHDPVTSEDLGLFYVASIEDEKNVTLWPLVELDAKHTVPACYCLEYDCVTYTPDTEAMALVPSLVLNAEYVAGYTSLSERYHALCDYANSYHISDEQHRDALRRSRTVRNFYRD